MSEQTKLTSPFELLEELKGEIGISSTPMFDPAEEKAAEARQRPAEKAETPKSEESTAGSDELKASQSSAENDSAGRSSICKKRSFTVPDAVKENLQLSELFERVNNLLGGADAPANEFRPRSPESIEETGLTQRGSRETGAQVSPAKRVGDRSADLRSD